MLLPVSYRWNGRPAKTAEGAAPVPAFIAGTHSRQVAAAYILQNQAEPVRKEDGLACYANRKEPLQQVVVSANKYTSLKEALQKPGRLCFARTTVSTITNILGTRELNSTNMVRMSWSRISCPKIGESLVV